jgi:tetratricopeptide (TPR) repeat protein
VQLLNAAQWDDAIAAFDMVLRILPDFAKAYHFRGLAYYNEEQYDLALENFSKAIELKPKFPDALRNRAVLHLNSGNTRLAVDDLEKALKLYIDAGDTFAAAEIRRMVGQAVRR